MNPYRKFDPYKNLVPDEPAKVAKVAKETDSLVQTATLAGLAALAARSAEPLNSSRRHVASSEHKSRSSLRRPPSPIHVPAEWVAGVSGIVEKPCPITIEPKRWLHLQNDADRFVKDWGRQAAALGWSTLDIFGCHPTHPTVRYDHMGLVWMIADAEIIAMGAQIANLRNAAGTLQRFWKCTADRPRIPSWEL